MVCFIQFSDHHFWRLQRECVLYAPHPLQPQTCSTFTSPSGYLKNSRCESGLTYPATVQRKCGEFTRSSDPFQTLRLFESRFSQYAVSDSRVAFRTGDGNAFSSPNQGLDWDLVVSDCLDVFFF